MTAACRLVWGLAGRPQVTAKAVAAHLKPDPGVCAICGTDSEITADADRALGANFSDRGHLTRFTTQVCPGCLWCCSGKPPATLRMWSIIAAPGVTLPQSDPKAYLQDTPGLMLYNRSNPGPLTSMLAGPPIGDWCASVALSGQKHVLPYTPVNHGHGQWTIRVEDHYVTATPEVWAHVHTHAIAMRRLGVPADAVLTGEPRIIGTPNRAALETWHEHNTHLIPYHNSPLLALALWTITKGIMQ